MANTAAALVTAEQIADLLRGLGEAGKERTAGKLRSYCRAAFEMVRTSKLTRGHLLSHGVTGVQAASYDGHDYAPQKLEALETLHRFLTETSASVVHIASRVVA